MWRPTSRTQHFLFANTQINMNFIVLLTLVVAVSCADLVSEWASYKREFKKDYSNGDEELHRMTIYLKNKKLIEEHNAEYSKGLASYTMKANHLTDMEPEEVSVMLNGLNKRGTPTNGGSVFVPPEGQVADSVDWRTKGVVTPVKDQAQCGSCWAFSAVGSIEGQHAIKTGQLVSLSEQNLVDCSSKYGNQGCNGGWMDWAFQYVKGNNGIDTEDCYKYTGSNGQCKFSKDCDGATITGFVDIPRNENALKQAVATVGPVSVAIDASNFSFQQYSSGIYDEKHCSTKVLDHGVLVVGYGTENGKDYWLVKNSWNTWWGDSGYIKMSRNKSNQCGIASKASYPTV